MVLEPDLPIVYVKMNASGERCRQSLSGAPEVEFEAALSGSIRVERTLLGTTVFCPLRRGLAMMRKDNAKRLDR